MSLFALGTACWAQTTPPPVNPAAVKTAQAADKAAAQASPAPVKLAAPKVDRSGEARLREIVRKFSATQPELISYSTYITEPPNTYLIRDGIVDFYVKDGKTWRLDASTMWGDSFLAVGTPTGIYVDSMGPQPATMIDPYDSVADVTKNSDLKGHINVLVQFVAGEGKFDDMVVKDAPIIDKKTGADETIEFKSFVGGFQRLTLHGDTITQIDTIADYGDTKPPRERDVVTINTNPKLHDWMFSTQPAPGVKVDDHRKKK